MIRLKTKEFFSIMNDSFIYIPTEFAVFCAKTGQLNNEFINVPVSVLQEMENAKTKHNG